MAVLDFNNNRDNPLVDGLQGFVLDNVVVPAAQSMGVEDEYKYLRPSIAAFLTGMGLFITYVSMLAAEPIFPVPVRRACP